jgi:hydroxymethylglutaryl-CoA lyase
VSASILVSEVGPRDGLQSISSIMPLAAKQAWIAAEAAAGVREIEVGSFVPAKLLPQLADTGSVVAFARTIPGLCVAVLVPNLRGAEAAVRAGVHKITIPLSASESSNLRNVRRTHAQMLDEIRAIAAMLGDLPAAGRPLLEGGLSTAFGCTIEGDVPEKKVIALAEALMRAGCDEIGLADTVGYANPSQVRSLVRQVQAAVGASCMSSLHLHNTRGLGLANVLAGLDVGITTFDSSLGGLGGCPYSPGASGNIVTEDLVFMLESMGLDTGIDLQQLVEVRAILRAALPDELLYGHTPDAGLPLGFSGATAPASATASAPQ